MPAYVIPNNNSQKPFLANMGSPAAQQQNRELDRVSDKTMSVMMEQKKITNDDLIFIKSVRFNPQTRRLMYLQYV
jgi:hypothetical protein